ncbi:uncharacterized protein [Drosophila tropicalis]|uniref:uncharacterized protein n=1 Tax=Drosophila tropicalis TaxID=46794 RepID=UPI0035ABB4ED
MFPQAELENYKLQVELLQEKLQRSEDNRQQLEHKLDKVLQKRHEFDKSVRQRNRQKYQEFLDEQSKRNERNRKLVQMLERVDEQTAIMSQRSERLKMMKLQYQMYFAKLVQNQTLRCIQHTQVPPGVVAAAGVGVGGGNMATIPVILQPQANAGQATTAGGVTGQPWTFAAMPFGQPQQAVLTPQFATPTSTVMPSAPAPATVAAAAAAPPHPHHSSMQATQPIYYPELYGGVPLATSNLFDLRATLRAFDNENADLPDRMATRFNMEAASEALTGDYRPEPFPTTVATPTTSSSSDTGRDKGVRQLSSTSSTLATSSLTFDKLPKTSSPTLTLTELQPATGFTPGPGFGPSSGQPQMPPHSDRLEEQNQQTAWTNSRVTKVEHEKSPNVVGNNEQLARLGPGPQHQQQQPQSNNFQTYFSEMKIDEPTEDKRELNVRTGMGMGTGTGMSMGTTRPAELGISNDLLEEVKASRAALEMAAAAVDEQLARGNQLSPPSAGGGGLMDELKPEARLSIENIENAIYGERLTAAAATQPPPTQGLLENLVTNKRTSEGRERERNAADTAVAGLAEPLDYGQYETASYSEPLEPIYASIDSNQQPAVAAVPTPAAAAAAAGTTVEPLYSEIGNPTDYQQYGAEGNAAASVAAETAAAEASVSAQEYSNIDYGNYETDQYAATGYDPNAYPGYIYDETTGQYIADPNAGPYATDGNYAGQEYDANVANYDYNAYAEQQQQQLLGEQQEGYPMTENTNNQLLTEMESSQPPATATPPAITTPTPTNSNEATVSSPPVVASKPPVKPTSILSSTDKQVPTNDAQQQQQLKKKKRVNFVDSSETDDSSSAKPPPPVAVTPSSSASPSASAATGAPPSQPAPVQAPASASTPVMERGAGVTAAGGTIAGSESDFDFSTGSEAKN